jgi:hypothetical protein
MNNYFEVRVKFSGIDEASGKEKKFNNLYLVDAMSFTEAESKIQDYLKPYLDDNFIITQIKLCSYTEVFPYEDGDKWYKCRIEFTSLDEVSMKEKKASNNMLVLAPDLEEGRSRMVDQLKDTISDWEITAVFETKILDII